MDDEQIDKKLVVFDLDGTLISCNSTREIIREIVKTEIKKGNFLIFFKVLKLYLLSKFGLIKLKDFAIILIRGKERIFLEHLAGKVLSNCLKHHDILLFLNRYLSFPEYNVAVVTSTFDFFEKAIKQVFKISFVFTTELKYNNGKVLGIRSNLEGKKEDIVPKLKKLGSLEILYTDNEDDFRFSRNFKKAYAICRRYITCGKWKQKGFNTLQISNEVPRKWRNLLPFIPGFYAFVSRYYSAGDYYLGLIKFLKSRLFLFSAYLFVLFYYFHDLGFLLPVFLFQLLIMNTYEIGYILNDTYAFLGDPKPSLYFDWRFKNFGLFIKTIIFKFLLSLLIIFFFSIFFPSYTSPILYITIGILILYLLHTYFFHIKILTFPLLRTIRDTLAFSLVDSTIFIKIVISYVLFSVFDSYIGYAKNKFNINISKNFRGIIMISLLIPLVVFYFCDSQLFILGLVTYLDSYDFIYLKNLVKICGKLKSICYKSSKSLIFPFLTSLL